MVAVLVMVVMMMVLVVCLTLLVRGTCWSVKRPGRVWTAPGTDQRSRCTSDGSTCKEDTRQVQTWCALSLSLSEIKEFYERHSLYFFYFLSFLRLEKSVTSFPFFYKKEEQTPHIPGETANECLQLLIGGELEVARHPSLAGHLYRQVLRAGRHKHQVLNAAQVGP